ncbi:MAG: hypothetical protein ACOVQ2_01830 [Flavobacterium sp.]
MEKFISVEDAFTIQDSWLKNTYFLLKIFSKSDTKTLGLELRDVMPIEYNSILNIPLNHKYNT